MKRTIAARLGAMLLAFSLILAGCATQDSADAGQPLPETEPETATPGEASAGSGAEAEPDEQDAPEAFPPVEWEFDLPENHGMDGELLAAMHSALDGTQITSVVVVRDGVVVDEYYADDFDETSVFRLNSCSKSFSSTLIGIAIDEGLLPGVDVSIAEYFPQLAGTDKEAITIRHLLEHTSGLQWSEFGGTAVSFWELNESENWVDYVLEQPMVATPGSTFTYSTGGTHLLTAILAQVVVEDTVFEYARTRLFGPLGMESVQWRIDPQGLLDGGNGIEMSTRDAAKFGQLFLNGGGWNGRQLVPTAWVAEATSVQVRRDGTSNGSYGFQWWIMRMGGYDTFYALGAMGQFIVVVPELDLVAAITSAQSADTNVPYTYLSNYILAAC